ncbi:MAG: aminotransferase class V-fold PLP-dependent enzyme [Gammaproteobacteria bacterium]|nr:aminotransferase class V-fold PLP-dependent enzyme [Gammaproteobacteria bacterium]
MDLYFDYNATTPCDRRVVDAMQPLFSEMFGNPSGIHQQAKRATELLEHARGQVATLVGAHSSQVIFTSGGSEANNLAIKGYLQGLEQRLENQPGRIAMSAIEHPSVSEVFKEMGAAGWDCLTIPVDGACRVDLALLESELKKGLVLLSIMAANNETGVIQDIEAIARLCRRYGTVFHCDAVQLVGKGDVDFNKIGADLLTISAHKIYGPKGVGALIFSRSLILKAQILGGGQEQGLRCGTENMPGIVGFGAAAETMAQELDQRIAQLTELGEYLQKLLKSELPQATIFGEGAERLPNTLFFAVPGFEGSSLIMGLDSQGYSLSSGASCGSTKKAPSQVLRAMGVDSELAFGAVRISLGKMSSRSGIDALIEALRTQVTVMGQMAAVGW